MADIRILVVDDHPLVRKGLAEVIHRAMEMRVVGEASDGASAIETARRCRPDVVLLDIGLPDMDGLQVLRCISSDVPDSTLAIFE